MKKLASALFLTSALTLGACGQAGQQWLDPDKTFALFDQPVVKGVNETQEEMAKEAAESGDYGRSAQLYQQIIASKKGTPEQVLRYKMALAEATRRLGDTENALAMFEELHRENPTNITIAEGRGLALMAAGKVSDAGRAFAQVLERHPGRWRTLNALGILFVSKNMIPEAIAYYSEALNNSPDNAAILNNVGLSYAVDRNFPRAVEALQHASGVSKVAGQRKQIDLNLAMVYGVSGDMDTARTVAGKYLEGPALDNNLGLYAHLAKDNSLARTYLNMALSQSPTFYERAWDNLDIVNDAGRGDDVISAKQKYVGAADLPKFDDSSFPEVKKGKWRMGKRKQMAPALRVDELSATPKSDAVEPAMAVPLSGTGNKPSGLVVGHSEGD